MGWILPYLLLVIFFAGFVPLVMNGMHVRDPEAEEEAREERTAQRVHALKPVTDGVAAGVAALGAIFAAAKLVGRRRPPEP